MIYRKLDSDGDYSFGKNLQNFLLNNEAVAQAIKTNLLLFKGEWWEDTSDGLPLFQDILGIAASINNQDAVNLIIKERITATKGVVKVLDCSSSLENRALTISYSAITEYSETPLNGVVNL